MAGRGGATDGAFLLCVATDLVWLTPSIYALLVSKIVKTGRSVANAAYLPQMARDTCNSPMHCAGGGGVGRREKIY
jgi:hypothetical protein